MSQTNTANQNRDHLNIDNVVASQPELGPSPPDGGYGWFVLACSSLTQLTIPSITVACGMLILYLNLQSENEESDMFHLWEHNIIIVPITLVIFSLLSASWSKTVISIANRPRVISISGVFLIVAGILLMSIGVNEEEDDTIYYIFAGLLAGVGVSLTNQQSEILLKHYFSTRLNLVQSIYKISVIFGNIIISIVMGTLYMQHNLNFSFIVYAGLMMQNCLFLIGYSRPTYIVAPIQKSYKVLKEASDDEEEIYPSQFESDTIKVSENIKSTNTIEHVEDTIISNISKNDQDEEIIGTFGAQNTKITIQINTDSTSRLENNENPFIIETQNYFTRRDDLQQPESLYRETTVANGEIQNNIFTFESPPINHNMERRTTEVKKNVIILFSALKDIRFYIYTYINLNVKFSALIIGLLFPAYISQQLPDMDMWSVTGLIVVVNIASLCLNLIIVFFSYKTNKKCLMAFLSLVSFFALFGLTGSHSKTWLILAGIMAYSSITGLFIVLKPIYEEMRTENETNSVFMTSNIIIAAIVIIITMTGNYDYTVYFKTAAILNMNAPILIAFIRKY